jgi:hypothetical protein
MLLFSWSFVSCSFLVLGVDADDSLYWITYSTQPSKILPATDATVDAIKKQAINENYKKLLKEFHSDLINPKKKVTTTLKKLEKEKEKISKLSKNNKINNPSFIFI